MALENLGRFDQGVAETTNADDRHCRVRQAENQRGLVQTGNFHESIGRGPVANSDICKFGKAANEGFNARHQPLRPSFSIFAADRADRFEDVDLSAGKK